jgi:peptidoglycan/xylan/chitin deacetylase (PgdA/CDA1 family)
MDSLRILLLSGSRPSRTWRIVDRIKREMPDAVISGIIQQPLPQLPLAQQLIAAGATDQNLVSGGAFAKASRWLGCALEELMHWAVWCVHGCPRGLNVVRRFTTGNLDEKCRQAGYPFVAARNVGDPRVLELVQGPVDLAIVLGEVPLSRELLSLPSRGLVRVSQGAAIDPAMAKDSVHLRLQYFGRGLEEPRTIASLAVPSQTYDALLGLALKTDMIADDLLVETAKALRQGSATQASEEVAQWVHEVYSPYVAQFQRSFLPGTPATPVRQRYRGIWKLCVDTLLLCSPWFVVRNWYRRWRGRYPVLILTHHLVSDRPHRMGISTETFWRQVAFLQRHYRVVSLDRAVVLLRSGNVMEPTVVLTFDDGYQDNFVSLRAVADEAGIPVSLFITTEPVDVQREFQHDLLHGTKGHLPLTWSQIRYWGRRGAEFGSHTRTHVDCGSVHAMILKKEFVESKKDLETHLGAPIRFFAFPFGKPENLSLQAIEIAASVYPYFASSLDGENLPARASNPHLLRRNLYPNRWELELELQSVFRMVDHWKRMFQLRSQPGPFRSKPQGPSASPAAGQSAMVRLKNECRYADRMFPQQQWSARLMRLLWTVVLAFLVLLSALPPFSRTLKRIVDEC